jgi:hypothetical protein
MKTKEISDGETIRTILIGMIVNTQVVGKIASQWTEEGLFQASEANRIGRWCVNHYRDYKVHPWTGIRSYLNDWAENTRLPEEEIQAVTSLLSSMSDSFQQEPDLFNADHVLDIAAKHFKKIKAEKLIEAVEADLQAGNISKAEERITKYSTVEMGVGSGIELFIDREAMRSTYAREHMESLVPYPGDMGLFFGERLSRDCFAAFMGVEKSGKSWWLLDIAYRAMLARRRVAYFQAGDLSEWQIKDRFLVRASQHPSRSTNEDGSWPCRVKIPVGIRYSSEEGIAQVRFDRKHFTGPLDVQKDWDLSIEQHIQKILKTKKPYFKLSCHPTKTLSMVGLRSILDGWTQHGFPPDVVAIDYADILAPLDKREDRRDQVKTNWEQMRRLSQELHCLVVTATQCNAAAYTAKTLSRANFSENHLKLAEVNVMYGINMEPEEKEQQITRLNVIGARDGHYNVKRVMHVAGCLPLSNPAVQAIWPGFKRRRE